MSIPFSRSMRSLQADGFRFSLVWLVIAIALLTAWLAWFFLAQITLYETGQFVSITRDGTVVASFSAESLGRIRQGQYALLRFDAAAKEDQAGPIPAIVLNVAPAAQAKGPGRVELYPLPQGASRIPARETLTGRVDVEIEYLSPAALVMRASGQLLDTPPVSLSPQKRPD